MTVVSLYCSIVTCELFMPSQSFIVVPIILQTERSASEVLRDEMTELSLGTFPKMLLHKGSADKDHRYCLPIKNMYRDGQNVSS